MNVNFVVNDSDTRIEGYENLDIKDALLEQYDNGEIENLRAYCVIEYLDDDLVEKALESWVNKVAIGGTITIAGIELYEVANCLINGTISLIDANELIHGYKNKKKNCFSVVSIRDFLISSNFSIDSIRIDNLKFSVKGTKNES